MVKVKIRLISKNESGSRQVITAVISKILCVHLYIQYWENHQETFKSKCSMISAWDSQKLSCKNASNVGDRV